MSESPSEASGAQPDPNTPPLEAESAATRAADAVGAPEAPAPAAPVASPQSSAGRPCPVCGRDWGSGIYCQFCNAVDGLPRDVRLATVGRRFAGYLLEILLIIVTLFIGWAIWSLIVWSRGTTPGKQLLGMRCVYLATSVRAGWGRMALREFVGKFLIMSVISLFTFGIGPLILDFMLLWTKKRQELWDMVADTIVVHDPRNELASRSPAVPA